MSTGPNKFLPVATSHPRHRYSLKEKQPTMPQNQTPEQKARDQIDDLLKSSGWSVQDKNRIDFNQSQGQAIREYLTDVGPADYVLFVDGKVVGVIKAKRQSKGENITTVEEQTEGYTSAKCKWGNSNEPLQLGNGQLNPEESRKLNKPRALIQMATGAGKTYTAITARYLILKHAKRKAS